MRKNYILNKAISPIEYKRFEGKAFYNHGELNIVFSSRRKLKSGKDR